MTRPRRSSPNHAGRGPTTGVIHCFSSGPQLAEKALALGFYLSFSGIVTFKKAEELRAVARNVPLDRMLVETDAPYLAPMPHRGKRNEPAFVVHTAALLAEFARPGAARARPPDHRQFLPPVRQGHRPSAGPGPA